MSILWLLDVRMASREDLSGFGGVIVKLNLAVAQTAKFDNSLEGPVSMAVKRKNMVECRGCNVGHAYPWGYAGKPQKSLRCNTATD